MENNKTGFLGGLRRKSARSGWMSVRGALAACAISAGALLFGASAEARSIVNSQISLDLATGKVDASFEFNGKTGKIDSPLDIAPNSFTKLDLKVRLKDNAVAERLMRKVDESYAPEPAGCRAGNYETLPMEDGLRYFFDVDAQTPEGVQKVYAVIFPGDRSEHFANDVFCEFDKELGEDGAVFHLTGYFYVIHRKTAVGWDVQLRAIRLTDKEIETQFE